MAEQAAAPPSTETPAAAAEVAPDFYAETPAVESDGAKFVAALPKDADGNTVLPTDDTAPPAAAAKADEPAKEEPKTEEKPAEAKPEPISREFAALSRKKQELKTREEVLAAKEKEVGSASALREGLKTDLIGTLSKELGVDAPTIYRAIVNHEEPETAAEPTADDRVAKLEEKLAAKETAEMQAAVDATKAQVVDAIKADERFELVNVEEAHDRVWKLICDYHKQWGEPLDPAIAAATIEEKIEQESTAKLERLAKTKKLSGKFAGSAGPQNQQALTEGASRSPETLNSTNTARPVPAAKGDDMPEDREERVAWFKRRHFQQLRNGA